MITSVCTAFFLSGFAALVFQVLWFHLAGITLGNTAWTLACVLAAFMTGMGGGNAFAVLQGRRISRPFGVLVLAQVVISGCGLGLVLLFPYLGSLLLPLYRMVSGNPFLLNLSRGSVAFVLMAVPAFCMGLTLPVAVKAVSLRKVNAAQAAGLLYGLNTLGAVIGVLAAQLLLVRLLGIRQTGVLAAFAGLATAGMIGRLCRNEKTLPAEEETVVTGRLTLRGVRLFSGAFLAGFALLALEMVWFRFLTLFFHALGKNFAVMLAVILAGIACGSLGTAYWLSRNRHAHRMSALAACCAGVLVCVLYASFLQPLSHLLFVSRMGATAALVWCAVYLIFPVSLTSGVLFTLFVRAMLDEASAVQATGLITCANTLGSAFGALAGGVVFLPHLGMERSFFVLALVYAAVALLSLRRTDITATRRSVLTYALSGCILVFTLAGFPFGMMRRDYSKIPLVPFVEKGISRIWYREGLNETVQYLQTNLLDRPYYRYLVTNGHAMSSTSVTARRYMNFFAWFPLAVHPQAREALLISYGLGNTAGALLDDARLEHIDAVDVSGDILESSRILYGGAEPDPLDDPRLSSYIEDGRFFLLTTRKKYDLITGEPPPPKMEGVVNLYTREYFALLKERLAEGGIVTYWLPVSHLKPSDARAIIAAFREIFHDAMIWAALPFDWMMVGTKGLKGPVTGEHFGRLWDDIRVSLKMSDFGFMSPEGFCSLFIADGHNLEQWLGGAKPLTDNYPGRLSPDVLDESVIDTEYISLMRGSRSLSNFARSRTIQRMVPSGLRVKAVRHFSARDQLYRILGGYEGLSLVARLHACLENPLLKPYLSWALESDPVAQRIVFDALQRGKTVGIEEGREHLAARSVIRERFREAEKNYRDLSRLYPRRTDEWYGLRIYLLYRRGELDAVRALAEEYIVSSGKGRDMRRARMERYFTWLVDNVEIP
ncbi:MAG: hypothetical protein MJA29_04640 [Candidatus Omnitrophica bacterium]|nr:hypothetical protein [Candidatus Omnitrophota bacterium]